MECVRNAQTWGGEGRITLTLIYVSDIITCTVVSNFESALLSTLMVKGWDTYSRQGLDIASTASSFGFHLVKSSTKLGVSSQSI